MIKCDDGIYDCYWYDRNGAEWEEWTAYMYETVEEYDMGGMFFSCWFNIYSEQCYWPMAKAFHYNPELQGRWAYWSRII